MEFPEIPARSLFTGLERQPAPARKPTKNEISEYINGLRDEIERLSSELQGEAEIRRQVETACAERIRKIASSIDTTKPEGLKAVRWLLDASADWGL